MSRPIQRFIKAVPTDQLPAYKANFNLPQRLGPLHIKGVTAAAVQWAPFYTISLNAQDAITKSFHPRCPASRIRWSSRTEPFQWSVLSTKAVSMRVVRSWAIRRTRVAIKEALQKKGYEEDGRPLKDATTAGKKEPVPLVGTMQILITQDAVKKDWAGIRREADLIIEHILWKGTRSEPQTPYGLRPRKGPPKRDFTPPNGSFKRLTF